MEDSVGVQRRRRVFRELVYQSEGESGLSSLVIINNKIYIIRLKEDFITIGGRDGGIGVSDPLQE